MSSHPLEIGDHTTGDAHVSFGFAPKLSFHVPEAAHTSSYCNMF
jgi:hypothetical protein